MRLYFLILLLFISGCGDNKQQKMIDPKQLYENAFKLDLAGKIEEAKRLYIESCENGYYQSCYNAGLIDEKDPESFFLKACDHGIGAACYELGKLSKKEMYHEKACRLRYSGGCMEIAKLFESKKMFKEALKWYKKACNLDDPDGCRAVEELR